MSAVKRKEVENDSSDSNSKRTKLGPVLRLTAQSNINPKPAFEITSKSTTLGRNTPELKALINNDKFVSREACSIVASSDGLTAVLSAQSLNPLRIFKEGKAPTLLNKGESTQLVPGDTFELFCNASTLVGAYPFILSIEGETAPLSTLAPENLVQTETLKSSENGTAMEMEPKKEVKDVKEAQEAEDPFYVELEKKLGLPEGLKQYFKLLWEEGFTNPELLSEVTIDDLKELNVKLAHRKQVLASIQTMWEKERSVPSQTTLEPLAASLPLQSSSSMTDDTITRERDKREQEIREEERREQERLEQEYLQEEKQKLERERLIKEEEEKEKVEMERLEIEKKEQEKQEQLEKERERQEQERQEQERQEKERQEKERQEKERQEKEKQEQERVEREKREQERLEHERLEQLEKERQEQARIEQERVEQERLERERLELERQEKERLEQERQEQERKEQERIEQQRLEQERLEKERLEQARLEEEKRQEQERQEKIEQERLEKERREEQQRLEEARLEKDRLERGRIEQEKLEQERLEKERIELERQTREIEEQERVEKERQQEQLRLEHERLEKERIEKEQEQERVKQEQAKIELEKQEKQQKIEKEKQEEEERLHQIKIEAERLEREKQECEKIEQERIEQERIERERVEQGRIERERLEQERSEKEKMEREDTRNTQKGNENQELSDEEKEKQRLIREILEAQEHHAKEALRIQQEEKVKIEGQKQPADSMEVDTQQTTTQTVEPMQIDSTHPEQQADIKTESTDGFVDADNIAVKEEPDTSTELPVAPPTPVDCEACLSRRACMQCGECSDPPMSLCLTCSSDMHKSQSHASHQPALFDHTVLKEQRTALEDQQLQAERQCIEICGKVLGSLQTILKGNFGSETRTAAIRSELEALNKKCAIPQTTVVVMGDTGAGKSSTLNALLGEESILPTNGMRACTAVIIELRYNDTPQLGKYVAAVEFLSKEEWKKELEVLFNDMRGEDGVMVKKPDARSGGGIALAKIRTVYGNSIRPEQLTTVDALVRNVNHITQHLGKTVTIKGNDPKKFRRQIEVYADSSNQKNDLAFWPLVKRICMKGEWEILKSGSVLVDAPGVRDDNSARDQVVKNYLKDGDSIWIVANIKRAVDDKTAKDMLGESFRRQLLMDGQYASLCFIATHADVLNRSEIIDNLELPEETSKLECALARNRYTKKRIQEDFKEGLLEMATNAKNTEFRSDYHLPVFTVSSMDYQKMIGHFTLDGPPDTFKNMHDTEITQLQTFVSFAAVRRRFESISKYTESLLHFLSNLHHFLSDDGTASADLRQSLHKIFNNKQEVLKKQFETALQTFGTNVRNQLSNMINTSKLPEGITAAQQAAVPTITKYGSHRSVGGLYWSTYKAVCRRNGCYSSGSAGQVDFNQALAEPIFRAISVNWDLFFGVALKELLRNHRTSLDLLVHQFTVDFSAEVKKLGVSEERVAGVCKFMKNDFTKKAEASLEKVIEVLQNEQRTVSRVVTPSIQTSMTPAYEGATNECGPGSYERMKALMIKFTDTQKKTMFNTSSELLVQGVNNLLAILVKNMMNTHSSLLQVMEVHTHVFWEAPADTKKVRLSLLPKVVDLHNTIRDVFTQVNQSGSTMAAILYAGKASDSPVKRDKTEDYMEDEVEQMEHEYIVKDNNNNNDSTTTTTTTTTTTSASDPLLPIKQEVKQEGGAKRDKIGKQKEKEKEKVKNKMSGGQVVDLTHVPIGGKMGTNINSDVIDLTDGNDNVVDSGYNYDESSDEDEEEDDEDDEEDEEDEEDDDDDSSGDSDDY